MTSRRRGGAGSHERDPDLFSRPSPPLPPSPERLESLEALGDTFPGASARTAVSVSTLTATVKDVLEGAFPPIWVRGEVTDLKVHRNGHWYFCLRDAAAQIRCVVWSRDRRGIPAVPDEGMQVVALGQLTVYAARGEMHLTVRRMDAEGDGLWRKATELTRARLAADGLLAAERKRPLPVHPRRIAVVTSPDGAALHDIVAVLRRRAPWVEIVLVPAAVQGENAPQSIIAALTRIATWRACDLVIVGRGGGAREDLRAFNDEGVARAIADCPVPIISAVGHEVDITLADLVADHRAPTPSAAAETAVRTRHELSAELTALHGRLVDGVEGRVAEARRRLVVLRDALGARSRRIVDDRQARLREAAGRLGALSPLGTLARGYAIARDMKQQPLTRAAQFRDGVDFELLVHDGRIEARVQAVHPESER